jgi:hypothetical protein
MHKFNKLFDLFVMIKVYFRFSILQFKTLPKSSFTM